MPVRPNLLSDLNYFDRCTSVKSLWLSTGTAVKQRVWSKACLAKFPNVSLLMLRINSACALEQPKSVTSCHRCFQQLNDVSTVGINLGGPPKLFNVSTNGWDDWFWEAPKGETLEWREPWEDSEEE